MKSLVCLLVFVFLSSTYASKDTEKHLKSIEGDIKKSRQRILVGEKQKTVEDLLKSNGSKSAFYVNAIVQGMPESIVLSEINYQPLEKRIRDNKPIVLEEGIIRVSGVSGDSELLPKWVQHLHAMHWVEDVAIVNYGLATRGKSEFGIEIKVAYDW